MKKVLRLLFAVTFLLIVKTQVYSQQTKALQVRFSPLNVFDPLTGVIQLGLQQRLGYRTALSIDYGMKFKVLSLWGHNNVRKNYRYYKTRFELKYFIERPGRDSNTNKSPYLALQGFYFPQTYTRENDYLYTGGKFFHYDLSDVKRNVYAASVLFGYEIKRKRIILDVYKGMGVRYITIKQKLYGAQESFPPKTFTSLDRKEGDFYRINMVLGFKVGYVIN